MRKLFSNVRDFTIISFDSFLAQWCIPSVKFGVLVIRLDAIGDFIIWLDAAKELRRMYPNKKITLLANGAWADLARCFNYWDEVIPVSLKDLINKPLYRWKMLRQVRSAGYDIVIQTQFSRVFLAGDSIVRASGARERIGSGGDMANIKSWQKRISDRWHTWLLPASKNSMMELERNAEFMSALSGKSVEPALSFIPKLLDLPQFLVPGKNFFIVFPGASTKIRQWPVTKFVEAIGAISESYDLLPVLCGAPSEKDLCMEVAAKAGASCIDYSGKTTLPELVEVIRNARLLVGNDTSAVHIAAAVGTPSVCILGGGHYGRFMPYPESLSGAKPIPVIHPMDCFNCNWRCVQTKNREEPYPCVASVSVERVVESVNEIMGPKSSLSSMSKVLARGEMERVKQ